MKNQPVEKTNAMRTLEKFGVSYVAHEYAADKEYPPSGTEVAAMLGLDASSVFKTLVTEGKSLAHFVFVVPVESELDLKKAAAAVGEKSLAMLPQKKLLPLTGYVHGGCSPIGMKKQLVTVVDISAKDKDKVFFSAGRIGLQVEVSPADLPRALRFTYADITHADSSEGKTR